MTYTPTNWSNVSSLSDVLTLVNTNTSNWGWVGILYTFWFILLITLIGFGWEVALLTSAFICIIAGLILSYMGLVGWTWVLFFVGIDLVMFAYSIWSSERH